MASPDKEYLPRANDLHADQPIKQQTIPKKKSEINQHKIYLKKFFTDFFQWEEHRNKV